MPGQRHRRGAGPVRPARAGSHQLPSGAISAATHDVYLGLAGVVAATAIDVLVIIPRRYATHETALGARER